MSCNNDRDVRCHWGLRANRCAFVCACTGACVRVRARVFTVGAVRLTQAAGAGDARPQVVFADHTNPPPAAALQVEDLLGFNHRRLRIKDSCVAFGVCH